MRRLLLLLLLLPGIALAQPARVGSLQIQNNLSELLANGSGAQTAAQTNLGLGSMATQGAGAVVITGGTIAGTPISGSTGSFTSLAASGTVSGAGITALLAPYAPLASPTFTGTVNGAAAAFTGNGTIGGTLGVTGALTGASLQSTGTGVITAGSTGGNNGIKLVPSATPQINAVGPAGTIGIVIQTQSGGVIGLIAPTQINGYIYQPLTTVLAGNTTNSQATSGLFLPQAFSGTSAVPGGAVLNSLVITDNINFTGAANGVAGSLVQMNYGGAATSSGRTALWAILNQTAATADLLDNFYVGATFQGIAAFNNGGTGLTGATAKGRVFGANPTVRLKNGATNYYQATAMELDTAIDTGASAAIKAALTIASLGASNTVQGSVVDSGIWFYKSNGAPIKNAILIGGGGLNNYPIDPAGSYISDDTSGSTTASTAYGLHFVGAFTTASIAVPGLTVDTTSGVTAAKMKLTGLPTTCAAQPTNTVAAVTGVLTLCP